METTVITTRLPMEMALKLRSIAKEEHLDRASLVRKMIMDEMDEYSLKKSAGAYRKGNVSLEEAAVRANVSIWKMMDYVRENNITPPPEKLEEMEDGLKRAEKILENQKNFATQNFNSQYSLYCDEKKRLRI